MPGNKKLFEEVKALNLPPGRFVLFGSAPLGIRNLRECQDIDILVTPDIWEAERLKPGWRESKTDFGGDKLQRRKLELLKEWAPGKWNTAQLIREAEIIDGLPFVRLDRVIESKKLSAREKDFKDIEMIEKFLCNT